MFKAITKDNFISKEDCEYLINLVESTDLWSSVPGSTWDKRSIHVGPTYSHLGKKAFNIIKNATLAVQEIIKLEYDLSENVYPDIASINRWFPGMSQHPHADDMTNTEIKGFEHRVFGSLIYLNDNYSGGLLYYPQYDFTITPVTGLLAIHPGDTDHIHGVSEVKDNMRYTISSFWVYDKGRGIDWSLYP
jgi:hypothetical protein